MSLENDRFRFHISHEVFGEGFYLVDLEVNRLSDQADVIPLMVSERLVDVTENYQGCTVEAIGQFRSYNRHEGSRNRLVLSVFVRGDPFYGGIYSLYQDESDLSGMAISARRQSTGKTPLGREIADILLAVNRPYGKSDYIPCIAWGRNARYASNFQVGTRVCIWGRVPEPGVYKEDQRVGM